MAKKSPFTESDIEAASIYLRLMEEAKTRFSLIKTITHEDTTYPRGIVQEICYLQLRCLCEVVTLGCLTAHGDMATPKLVRKTYEPSKILKALDKLEDRYYYPQPADVVTQGNHTHYIARPDKTHLAKDEISTLWGLSGDRLHRTSLNKFLRPSDDDMSDFTEINQWTEKLIGLLEHHWIVLVKYKKGIFVSLFGGEDEQTIVQLYEFDESGSTADRQSVTLGRSELAQ